MTPNDIEILIHCHVCPLPHPRADAPAVEESLRNLFVRGLIEKDGNGGYHTTGRGNAHVVQLCSMPWPTQAWVDTQGKIIEMED